MTTPPATEPGPIGLAGEPGPAEATTTVTTRHIFPPDGRTNLTGGTTFPTHTVAHFSTGGNCTTALIGRTTGITAAHCVYKNGWKTWPNSFTTNVPGGQPGIAFGANNPTGSNPITPYGRYIPVSLTVPGSWAATSDDYPMDFAIVEWAPTHAPGDYVSWFGVEQFFGNPTYFHGYSGDQPAPLVSQLFRNGDMAAINGSRYKHYTDVVVGDSGGAFYNSSFRVTCVQSTEEVEWTPWGGTVLYNYCRRWDSTTYNFFDAYAVSWP